MSLEQKAKEMYEKIVTGMLAKRSLILTGETTFETCNMIRAGILMHNCKSQAPITLLIDSYGGSCEAGSYLFDIIKVSKAPIIGLVNGKCHSTASIILQACHKRLSLPHSNFVIHVVSSNIAIPYDNRDFEERLKIQIDMGIRHGRSFVEIYHQRSGLPHKEIERMMLDGERYNIIFSAAEMLKMSLLD